MSRSVAIGVLAVLLGLVVTGCSADVTTSDEYRAIEADLSEALEAQEESAALAQEAQSELDAARLAAEGAEAEARDSQAEAVQARARAEAAEKALDDIENADWPDAIRSGFISGCAESADDGEAVAFCTCAFKQLQSSYSVTDFLVLSMEASASGAESDLFSFSPDSDPEFLKAITDATVDCTLNASADASKSVWDLEVGDCFADPPTFDVVEIVAISECSVPHDNEAFAVLEMPGHAWPGEDTVDRWANTKCEEFFESYVGLRWESSVLDYWYLFPLEQSWVKQGDRTVTCALFDANEAKLTSSMQGSGA